MRKLTCIATLITVLWLMPNGNSQVPNCDTDCHEVIHAQRALPGIGVDAYEFTPSSCYPCSALGLAAGATTFRCEMAPSANPCKDLGDGFNAKKRAIIPGTYCDPAGAIAIINWRECVKVEYNGALQPINKYKCTKPATQDP